MVPDLASLGRRKLLLGLGGLTLSTGTVGAGVGLTRPTLLPDAVTDEWIERYPTPPEVTDHWRPTVTEAHATWAVDSLAETATEAERLDARIDEERQFTGAGGWLKDARKDLGNGNYHTALSHATYGMEFAAEDLGRAMARLDELDRDALRRRADRLRERAAAVRDSLEPYPVADPGVDLAWYYHVEIEALIAANGADWPFEDGESVGRTAAGDLLSELRRAEIHVESAERFRDHLDERLDGSTAPYRTHLDGVAGDFRAAAEDVPTRDEAEAERGLEDAEDWGHYEVAHAELARRCLPSGGPTPWTVAIPDRYRVLRAVALSQGIARARAYEFAVANLVVDPDDGGFDAGHVLAEKRRARDVYRARIGSDPPPLLTRQASRAIEDLQVATVDHADDWPPWRERLDAYLYALTGRAKLKEYPTVYRIVADPD